MSKIVVIVGPTASGKTKLSIELAKYINAEIINADAVQIYKEVNIGSAKVTKEETEGIPHHLLNYVSLNENYTLYDYQLDARNILNKLLNENKNVVIVGGSGLYLKALLYDYELKSENKIDLCKYNNFENKQLKEMADKISINNGIHLNNRNRLLRFISHYDNTGEVIINKPEKDKLLYNIEIIGLKADRTKLYEKINLRVDNMFKKGLVEEAKKLFDGKIDTNSIIGYKELNKYFNGEISLEEAKTEIKKNTRHYAKRQYTWFNNQFDNINWIEVNYDDFDITINEAISITKR